ncbi:thiol-disulfide oxidoreductase DCC family protein [Staphylococcus chromogenes]|uniref:thiol-disulfide oxidoreductase DCC family protein n=1 Tax=Staphylococcus chromogenes TaxID=46126 RepID=UPI002884B4C1|nr:DUF393 domain-containing protein [Staphylococcus chromogenes]MDT0700365.1 DUF393 domain-containing protein [Staphylococcus chromogenes]
MGDIILFYDGSCKLCLNTINIFEKIDIFKKIKYKDFKKSDYYKNYGISESILNNEMVINNKGQNYFGFDALLELCKVLPLLWVCYPFMRLIKITGYGNKLYSKLSSNRYKILGKCDGSCNIRSKSEDN